VGIFRLVAPKVRNRRWTECSRLRKTGLPQASTDILCYHLRNVKSRRTNRFFLFLKIKHSTKFVQNTNQFVNSEQTVSEQWVNSAPERAKEVKRRDKYSIRESEGEKIVQKDEETDKDGKTAG